MYSQTFSESNTQSRAEDQWRIQDFPDRGGGGHQPQCVQTYCVAKISPKNA